MNISHVVLLHSKMRWQRLFAGNQLIQNTDRKKQRQAKLQEKVDAYFEWVKQKYNQVTHNSTIGKALAYSINQEKYLRVFLTDGMAPPDNNYAEQAIRPFTIRKKLRSHGIRRWCKSQRHALQPGRNSQDQ